MIHIEAADHKVKLRCSQCGNHTIRSWPHTVTVDQVILADQYHTGLFHPDPINLAAIHDAVYDPETGTT